MNQLDRTSGVRRGILLALATAVISGVSIYVNGFAVRQLPDAAVFTTLKNGVAAVVLVGLALGLVGRRGIARLDRRAWGGLGLVAVIGGSVPFLLFFGGLAVASAPSAAFIHKTLFVWVALLAVPFLGERLGLAQLGALAVLLVGQYLVAPPTGVAWGSGETMIAVATLLWAVEVVVARRLLLGRIEPAVLGAGRLGLGLVVLTGYLAVTGKLAVVAALTPVQWSWALGTGILLAGYVATWFAALRLAPASLVTAVLVLGAPITALLGAISTGALPAPAVVAGDGLIVAAAASIVVVWLRSARARGDTAPIVARAEAK